MGNEYGGRLMSAGSALLLEMRYIFARITRG